MADFRSTTNGPVSDDNTQDDAETPVADLGSASSSPTSTEPSPPSSPSEAPGHVVIAKVQIMGASSTNDLVALNNPTAAIVDLSNWKLHKRSNTGTEYSLKAFPEGASIGPGGYFVWANSSGGFADSIGADVSSTETLAADNSVALLDPNGSVVDAVAWGSGTGQYVEGSPYATDPAQGQVLVRRSSGGTVVDTDDNASDFILE